MYANASGLKVPSNSVRINLGFLFFASFSLGSLTGNFGRFGCSRSPGAAWLVRMREEYDLPSMQSDERLCHFSRALSASAIFAIKWKNLAVISDFTGNAGRNPTAQHLCLTQQFIIRTQSGGHKTKGSDKTDEKNAHRIDGDHRRSPCHHAGRGECY